MRYVGLTMLAVGLSMSLATSAAAEDATSDSGTEVQRLPVLFTARATDDTGIASLLLDLSAIGGSPTQTMYDDGSNGDTGVGDHNYAFRYTLPAACPTGNFLIPITATDLDGEPVSTLISLNVDANNPPYRSVTKISTWSGNVSAVSSNCAVKRLRSAATIDCTRSLSSVAVRHASSSLSRPASIAAQSSL